MAPRKAYTQILALLPLLLGITSPAQATVYPDGCVLTGSVGECSEFGCCDSLVECTSEGGCVLPPPGCTSETCGEGEICAAAAVCTISSEVILELNPDPSSEATGKIIFESHEDITLYTDGGKVTETYSYNPQTRCDVHLLWDPDMIRPVKAYCDTEDGFYSTEVQYDEDGHLVSLVEDPSTRRSLEAALLVSGNQLEKRRLDSECQEICSGLRASAEIFANNCELTTANCIESGNIDSIICNFLQSICDTLVAVATLSADHCESNCFCPTPAPTESCSSEGEECNPLDSVSGCCRALFCVENTLYPDFGSEFCCSVENEAQAHGDPHLVGFYGQKFDFTGQDGGYYALLVDEPDTLLTMKVHAPVPTVPQITYIVGFALKANDLDGVSHTVEIYANHPKDFYAHTECPGGMDEPCLADGALTVLLDGKPMVRPGVETVATGFIVGAVNVPGECRPFGFENYWARKIREAEVATGAAGRRLEDTNIPMGDWILGDDAATNIAECEIYVINAMEQDTLFKYQSEHVSFQIVTPLLTIRVNHGKLHQIAMRDPTDQFDLPDHRTFQQNIGVERAIMGPFPQGVLGETIRPTLDTMGEPIMFGMAAIRGREEDYSVSGPFDDMFAIRQG